MSRGLQTMVMMEELVASVLMLVVAHMVVMVLMAVVHFVVVNIYPSFFVLGSWFVATLPFVHL